MPVDDLIDPRVARTRRDVVDTAAHLLLESGWDAVTHGEVARRASYSKATLYTHWPTPLDLIAAAIEQICSVDHHPLVSGDLRRDLQAALADFAADLTTGHLDRLLAGVVERASTSDVVRELRGRLYATGTSSIRTILEAHLSPVDIEPAISMLTGAVLVRVTFEGEQAGGAFIADLVERVLNSATEPVT